MHILYQGVNFLDDEVVCRETCNSHFFFGRILLHVTIYGITLNQIIEKGF
jgi:hypothetical protein